MKKALKKARQQLGIKESFRNVDYKAGGFAVRSKNLSFFTEQKFKKAWEFAHERNLAGWKNAVPDIRWRAHLACFAANHGLSIEGDFVEFGVHTGILSATICKFLDFEKVKKKFYLFDTYEGIPEAASASEGDKKITASHNKDFYFDCYDITKETFSEYKNVALVKGLLPESFDTVKIDKIAYVSIDLNSAFFEKQTIEKVWDKITPSAFIVIDDYAFKGHEEQYNMWNEFAASKGKIIFTVPTGQGLLIK
jgi:O-methyltransferase